MRPMLTTSSFIPVPLSFDKAQRSPGLVSSLFLSSPFFSLGGYGGNHDVSPHVAGVRTRPASLGDKTQRWLLFLDVRNVPCSEGEAFPSV